MFATVASRPDDRGGMTFVQGYKRTCARTQRFDFWDEEQATFLQTSVTKNLVKIHTLKWKMEESDS